MTGLLAILRGVKPRVRVKAVTRRVRDKCCSPYARLRCADCPHSSFPALYRFPSQRNELIRVLLAKRKWSYAVIARMVSNGCTRNTVAGVAFRAKWPANVRVHDRMGKPTKIGHGWQPASYRPEKTVTNTVA